MVGGGGGGGGVPPKAEARRRSSDVTRGVGVDGCHTGFHPCLTVSNY